MYNYVCKNFLLTCVMCSWLACGLGEIFYKEQLLHIWLPLLLETIKILVPPSLVTLIMSYIKRLWLSVVGPSVTPVACSPWSRYEAPATCNLRNKNTLFKVNLIYDRHSSRINYGSLIYLDVKARAYILPTL